MKHLQLLPRSLAGRFGLASAGMAAAAVLLVALTSWWLIGRQQDAAEDRLLARERHFHAANIGSTLRALSTRMTEVASSTILATGLVDSAGKETYLGPFLNGVRQVNGIPVQVLFTDFEGKEIASNAGARFTPVQLQWLRRQLASGTAGADILPSDEGPELVAVEPLRYQRTNTPEGALFYKLSLSDVLVEPGLRLTWGGVSTPASEAEAPVIAPPVFAPINFRVVGESLAPSRVNRGAPEYLAIAALAFGVFAALFMAGARLARLLTRDLSRLEVFSSEVVSAGGGTQRAPETGSAEVASLAVSINRMLDRLVQQHQALKLEGQKMASLAEALKVADQRKDEFLAMLAHELRNPLAPIRTGAELLRAVGGTNPQVQRTSEIISRQVRHMTKIVDDLLDVSRVTRGLVTLESTPVDLHTAMSSAADQVRPLVQAREQHLDLQLPEGPVWVNGDPARLVQVISNLLHNACKYTQQGGRIAARVEEREGEAIIVVEDNGSGISPEFLPEIFGLFTQAARLSDRAQGGLGLGLALVKRLVELHRGDVVAHSPGAGQGSTFTVRLPRMEMSTLPRPAPAQVCAPEAGDGGSESAGKLRIMLVDDNIDAAHTLAALLALEGHVVEIGYEANAALTRAASGAFDVFILDIGLPGMDGLELARRLRHMPHGRGAVLVALTGYGQTSDREQSAQAGFDHHLVKPVDPDALEAVLASVRARSAEAGLVSAAGL